LGYWIPREEFWLTLFFYASCFLSYFLINSNLFEKGFSIRYGMQWALVLRVTLILAIPALSDDFYRYIFDGHLLRMGINPYSMSPSEILPMLGKTSGSYFHFLFDNLNSPNYFSIYPPLHQVFFYLASLGGESLLKNIIILRIFILLFDFLNIYLLQKILILLKKPISGIWLYAFNPLVIIELTGNLHFEGLVLTGILCLVYFWISKRKGLAALGWSFAIGLKLTPLILGPTLLFGSKRNKAFSFFLFSSFFISAFLFPLIFSNGFQKFWQSFRLFQSTFEFNASLYYLTIWISGFFIDYNPIAYVGPTLSFVAFVSIVFFSLVYRVKDNEKLCLGIVYVYLIYLLLQNVVHPWYIIPAFGVSVLTGSRIFWVWTGLVFLSYNTYSNENFDESGVLLIVEYGILFVFIFKEIFFRPLSSKIKPGME
jgi:hypothetical protein